MTNNSGIGKRRGAHQRSGRCITRKCARAGCERSSAFTLVFDYSKAEAWLCDLWAEAGPGSYDLCVDHAERFTVPLGWNYIAKRQASPALFVEASVERGAFEIQQESGPQRVTA